MERELQDLVNSIARGLQLTGTLMMKDNIGIDELAQLRTNLETAASSIDIIIDIQIFKDLVA